MKQNQDQSYADLSGHKSHHLLYQNSIGRTEALELAKAVLEKAEAERLQVAEWEASRGIQYNGAD